MQKLTIEQWKSELKNLISFHMTWMPSYMCVTRKYVVPGRIVTVGQLAQAV